MPRFSSYGILFLSICFLTLSCGKPATSEIKDPVSVPDEAPKDSLPDLHPGLLPPSPNLPLPPVNPGPKTQVVEHPTYPYREIPAADHADGKKFQCWDYAKRAWIDMAHRREGRVYWIRTVPCLGTRGDYPPLELPLKAEPLGPPGPDSDDWDYDDC